MKFFKFWKPRKREVISHEELERLRQANLELNERLKNREKEIEEKLGIIARYEKIKESIRSVRPEPEKPQKQPEVTTTQKKKKIGEILLSHNLITKEMLDRALAYNEQSGGSITQYLLAYGYIDERQLAQCLCTQFGIPYLPLTSYDISEEIIKLVPVDIAQKYWLIPVDKRGDSLMVVMIDPLDTRAIKEIEDVTGYKVMPFVGIISEIVEALEIYYKIFVRSKEAKGSEKQAPFFIDSKTYRGLERRRSIRFKVKIDLQFAVGGSFKKTQTKNISRGGLSFDSDIALQVGSLITLQFDLPKTFSPLPILAIVQVARIISLGPNRFEISSKMIKISKQELTTLIEYASIYEEK